MSRVQTGVRIDKGVLKVLKAVAEYEEISLGALLERIVLSSFAGGRTFDEEALGRIVELSRVYGLDLEAASEPAEASAAPGLDSREAEQDSSLAEEDSGLAEALDGLSRMLGDDD